MARHPDARWRVSIDAVEELRILQRRLLNALLPLLAPQGRLVYATCTIHPRENEDQIRELLAVVPELTLLSQHQRWPDDPDGGDGFYAAVLQLRS